VPFLEHAKEKPFFFTWDKDNYLSETAFCWTERAINSPKYQDTLYMSHSLPVKGKGASNALQPILDLPLESSLDLKAGSGSVTFTRASSATYVKDGIIQYSPGGSVTNLLTYSEQFDNVAWNGSTSVTANQTTAPDGVVTADLLVQPAGTSIGGVNQTLTPTLDTTYTASIYVKAKEHDECFIQFRSFHSTGWKTAVFDLTTGTITFSNTGGVANIEPLSDGWYRCSASITTDQSILSYVVFGPADGGNVSITHNGTDGLYIWGAQLKVGTFANGYVPTTTASATDTVDGEPRFEANGLLIEGESENLQTYSEQFDNAAYFTDNASITADAVTAPDGATTADKLVENTATSTHGVGDGHTYAAGTHTISLYAKAGERSEIQLIGFDGTDAAYSWFNLSTGVAGSTAGANFESADIQSLPDGWYRCSVTFDAAGASGNWTVRIGSGSETGTYLGDGTSGLYIWGAQLEEQPAATSYIPTAGVAVTRSAESCAFSFSGNLPAIGASVTIHTKWDQILDNAFASRPIQINGITNYFIQIAGNTTAVQAYYGATANDAVALSWEANKVFSSTLVYNGSTVEAGLDGVLSGSPATATIPTGTPSTVSIGSGGTTIQWGHISGVKIFNKALSADEVAAL
jgi:hypothetical protein